MFIIYKKITQFLNRLSRNYICDEDPDERRTRLREEAMREIDAQVLPVVQMRLAMQLAVQESDAEQKPKTDSVAA